MGGFFKMDVIQPVHDAQQIIEVIHAAFKRYEADTMPSSALVETEKTIESELQQGVLIFGSYVNQQLVGVIKVLQQKDYFYFSRLSVLPSFQGKGIASALIDYIETRALQEEILYVRCKVRKSETNNIRLYKKLGYEITKEELTTSPTGFVMATVTMDKAI